MTASAKSTVEKLNPFAKKLRKTSTDTEQKLWYQLRAKRFQGIKFRRQHPIGPFIVDFVCLERKVIIECDGGGHDDSNSKDIARDLWLRNEGFKVLRFWNSDILQNTQSVLEEIYRILNSA